MSIIDILNYSNIARSTLYQWVYKYSHIQYDQFIDRTIKLRSYNKETVYKKINEQCVKNIIEYVLINPIINIKKIKKMNNVNAGETILVNPIFSFLVFAVREGLEPP